jgi:ribosome-associated protein
MSGISSSEKTRIVAAAALDKLGEDLVALDVHEVVSFADTFVVVTGRSDRHVRSIADAIDEAVSRRGERPLGIEGYDEGRWVLMDLADVVVHVFQAEVRAHYDLERLWSDAQPIALDAAEAGARKVVP